MRSLLDHLWQEWKSLNEEVKRVSDEIDAIATEDAACQRLAAVMAVCIAVQFFESSTADRRVRSFALRAEKQIVNGRLNFFEG